MITVELDRPRRRLTPYLLMALLVALFAVLASVWLSLPHTQNDLFGVNWALQVSVAAPLVWLTIFVIALWRIGLRSLWLLPLGPIAANAQIWFAVLRLSCEQGNCL